MKKIISIIICAILLLSLFSCDNGGTNDGSNNNSSSSNDIETTPEADNQEPLLREQCDVVLCSGYDTNGNYYELVGTQRETSTSFEIKLGVIKNNKWLMPLSNDFCFISDDGLIHTSYEGDDLYESTQYVTYSTFHFIDIGGFVLYKRSYGDTQWDKIDELVYLNCNTQQHITLSDEYSLGYGITEYDERTEHVALNTDNGNIILHTSTNLGSYSYPNYVYDWYLLDINTMNIKKLCSNVSIHPFTYCYLSEGLILAEDFCFYNKKMEKVLDISDMNAKYDQTIVFENGTCRFKAENSLGTEFWVTIDKTGKVLSEEQIEKDSW